MKYISTRDSSKTYSLSEALVLGLAPDGGLFIPQSFPKINTQGLNQLSFPELAHKVLTPFFKEDLLESSLNEICTKAFNFPLITKNLNDQITIAELFHGPTKAFKDFGAKFLAESLSCMNSPFTILVATSGDTGGAVASAFYKKDNIKVGILFPKDGVSKEQFSQLTSWGDNIYSFAVDGTFDDCQKLVKEAFTSNLFLNLTSANSINIGRVLAQMTYYAYLSLQGQENFIIPSGNVGNSIGAFWAKAMGFPIKKIILATNENESISHYHKTLERKSFPTIKTLANAMDVGSPSNLERLDKLSKEFDVLKVSDEVILETIKKTLKNYNYLIDPHTATALTYAYLNEHEKWTVMSTAHPEKFRTVLLSHVPESSLFLSSLEPAAPLYFSNIKPSLDVIASKMKS